MIHLFPSLIICDETGEKVCEKVESLLSEKINGLDSKIIFDHLKIENSNSNSINKAFLKLLSGATRADGIFKNCYINTWVEVFILSVISKETVLRSIEIAEIILNCASRCNGGSCSLILFVAQGVFNLSEQVVSESMKLLKEKFNEVNSSHFKRIYFVDEYNDMGLILDTEEEIVEVSAVFISSYIASEMSQSLRDITRPQFDKELSQSFSSFSCYLFKFDRQCFLSGIATLIVRDFIKKLYHRSPANPESDGLLNSRLFAGLLREKVSELVADSSPDNQTPNTVEIEKLRQLSSPTREYLIAELYRIAEKMNFNFDRLKVFLEDSFDLLMSMLEAEEEKIRVEKRLFTENSVRNIHHPNPSLNELKERIHIFNLMKETYFGFFLTLDRIYLGLDLLAREVFSLNIDLPSENNKKSKFDFNLLETTIIENYYSAEFENLTKIIDFEEGVILLLKNLLDAPKNSVKTSLIEYCLGKLNYIEEISLETIWNYSMLPIQLSEKLSMLAPLNLVSHSDSERFLVIMTPPEWKVDEDSFQTSFVKKLINGVNKNEAMIIQIALGTEV